MIRPLAVVALCGLLLAACSQGGASKTAAAGPGAGLDAEILTWRTAVETSHAACARTSSRHQFHKLRSQSSLIC